MFECFHCGNKTLIWDSDFDAEDCGYDCPGIVQFLHCDACGALVEYKIFENDEKEEKSV